MSTHQHSENSAKEKHHNKKSVHPKRTDTREADLKRFWRKVNKRELCALQVDDIDLDLTQSVVSLDTKGYPRIWQGAKYVSLHRIIAERVFGVLLSIQIIDHINNDILDARRCNLRVTDSFGNMQNRKDNPLRGTTLHKKSKKWQASVMHNGKFHYLGLFCDRTLAASAASQKRKELGFLGKEIRL